MSDRLSEADRARLALMIDLHQRWQAWQDSRTASLLLAARLIDDGVLSLANVCMALDMSPATWYRHRKALRPVRGSELEAAMVAEIDQALRAAGATDATTLADVKNNPDLELALAAIGVDHRTEQE